MFASLDQIDISLNGGGGVIVDDRPVSEIEREPELSVLCALTRMLQYMRAGDGRLLIYYAVHGGAPDFLRNAVASVGGVMCATEEEMMRVIGDFQANPGPQQDPELADGEAVRGLLNTNLTNLVQGACAAVGIGMDLDGLRALEERLHPIASNAGRGGEAQGQVTYWRSVFELGGLCGEVIRSRAGGHWDANLESRGAVPVALDSFFAGQQAWLAVLGKAIKYFASANGADEQPSALADTVLQAVGRSHATQ